MRTTQTAFAGAALAAALMPLPLVAQDNPLYEQVMYGIDRQTSELVRYDFAAGQSKLVGLIRTRDGTVLRGSIDAAAYAHGTDELPAFTHLYAFRWDAENYAAQMLYVDLRDGTADVGNAKMEGGPIGGATAVFKDGAWQIYAVQHELVTPPFRIVGTIANINPNNSNDMSFELVKPDGSRITREDLKNAKPKDLDAQSNLYVGMATEIRIRPKGNGNNNTLMVTYPGEEPQVMELRNSNTYVFTGNMQVRLFNVKNGGNMGHWWLEVDGSAYLNNDIEILSPHRLVMVSQKDDPVNQLKVGTVTELVNLSRAYDSLATQDGVVFYASYHNELWRIDLSAEPHNREQRVDDRVAPNHFAKLLGQEMVNGNLFAYEVHHGNLHLVDRQTGNVLGHIKASRARTSARSCSARQPRIVTINRCRMTDSGNGGCDSLKATRESGRVNTGSRPPSFLLLVVAFQANDSIEGGHLGRLQHPPLANTQTFELQRANGNALQPTNLVPQPREHSANLAVLPFAQRHFQLGAVARPTIRGVAQQFHGRHGRFFCLARAAAG